MRRTKIVCTLGPASDSPEKMQQLIRAGMNVARLNLAHGSQQDHARLVQALRQASAQLDAPVAILMDVPGPKLRVGKLQGGQIALKPGDPFLFTAGVREGDVSGASLDLPALPILQAGALIYLADGALKLRVEEAAPGQLRCTVVAGGSLTSGSGVHIPGVALPGLAREPFLRFALEQGADWIALSFVSAAADVLAAKRALREGGVELPIIAKIETGEALDHLEEILEAADGAMVARGDLGVQINIESVPIAQKQIIKKCNHLGKPVITATQMLESMLSSPVPTRAEAADVANAIIDGSDALMLSEETAMGRYPEEAVAVMARIAEATEATLPYEQILAEKGRDLVAETRDATAYAACHIAHQLGARAIVVFTSRGSTALRVAKYRPGVPILAITPSAATRRRLALSWGVAPYLMPETSSVEAVFERSRRLALEAGLGGRGDVVVITFGLPLGVPGSTNLIKIEELA